MTTTQNKLQTAASAAEAIIASFSGITAPDAIEARRQALLSGLPTIHTKMSAEDVQLAQAKIDGLINHVLELEKPKTKDGLTVEQVARAFMESPDLAMFTWPQIALLVKRVLPEANTSSKSIASYASKRKGEWKIVQRERFVFDPSEYMTKQAA